MMYRVLICEFVLNVFNLVYNFYVHKHPNAIWCMQFQVSFSKFKYIMVPYCYGTSTNEKSNKKSTGEHWMLLVANTERQTVSVLNSKDSSIRYKEAAKTIVDKWM